MFHVKHSRGPRGLSADVELRGGAAEQVLGLDRTCPPEPRLPAATPGLAAPNVSRETLAAPGGMLANADLREMVRVTGPSAWPAHIALSTSCRKSPPRRGPRMFHVKQRGSGLMGPGGLLADADLRETVQPSRSLASTRHIPQSVIGRKEPRPRDARVFHVKHCRGLAACLPTWSCGRRCGRAGPPEHHWPEGNPASLRHNVSRETLPETDSLSADADLRDGAAEQSPASRRQSVSRETLPRPVSPVC